DVESSAVQEHLLPAVSRAVQAPPPTNPPGRLLQRCQGARFRDEVDAVIVGVQLHAEVERPTGPAQTERRLQLAIVREVGVALVHAGHGSAVTLAGRTVSS